jgi:hypothetical protein
VLPGRRKSELPADPASATAYASRISCQGCSRRRLCKPASVALWGGTPAGALQRFQKKKQMLAYAPKVHEAGKALGVGWRAIYTYLDGTRGISQTIALLCDKIDIEAKLRSQLELPLPKPKGRK